jgi:hypothetical protein
MADPAAHGGEESLAVRWARHFLAAGTSSTEVLAA